MNKKEKLAEFYSLLHHLRKQFPAGEGQSTYNHCSNDCGDSVRGGGLCAGCCVDEMAGLLGNEDVPHRLRKAILDQRIWVNEALELLE